jgi:rhodanese-related sulfurtransferase
MSKLFKFLVAAVIAVFAVGSLAACSASEPIEMSTVAAVIDVRTPEEWAAGHLDGAVRIGIADADFAQQLDTLDKSADYYIYCRSGNRAGQAIDYMKSAGFTGKLVNGGAVANAANQTGLAVVTGE